MRPQPDFIRQFVPSPSNQSAVARAKTCRFCTSSNLKPWQSSAGEIQKNYFLENRRPARVQTTDGKVRKASLMDRLSLNGFGLTTGRLERRTCGGRSSDPTKRSGSAGHAERCADQHYPAKSRHERFVDCAMDELARSRAHIFRNFDGRELYRLSLQRLRD
jgi:hypothetical protein